MSAACCEVCDPPCELATMRRHWPTPRLRLAKRSLPPKAFPLERKLHAVRLARSRRAYPWARWLLRESCCSCFSFHAGESGRVVEAEAEWAASSPACSSATFLAAGGQATAAAVD